MSVNTSNLIFDRDVITQLSQKNAEPDWMLDFRLKALEKASSLPLPNVEKTHIRQWNFTEFQPYTEEAVLSRFDELPETVRSFAQEEADGRNLIVQHNSTVVYTELMPDLQRKGVIFTDLHTALREHGDLVRKVFMTDASQADEHKLTALHAALWSGGAFLYVPKNVELDVPIQSLVWTDKSGIGLLPHLVIVAEDNSRLTYVDSYVSAEGVEGVVHNGMTEIFVGPGASVQYATLHHYSEGVTDVSLRRATVARDGRVDWIVGDLNNGNTVSDNTTYLKGDGSQGYVKSITIASGKQENSITSNIRHYGKNTPSDILARAVVKDSSTSILNSITKIEKGAKRADGQQTGRVLMMNEKSRGDANPILLIDENDVTAGHAASAGKVDPLQIYYLMSRGMTKADAERLIIYGFLNPLLEEIPIEDVVKQLKRVIERKLR